MPGAVLCLGRYQYLTTKWTMMMPVATTRAMGVRIIAASRGYASTRAIKLSLGSSVAMRNILPHRIRVCFGEEDDYSSSSSNASPFRSDVLSRWAYLADIAIVLCPAASWMTFRLAPL